MSAQVDFPSPTRPISETPLRYGVIIYPGYQALDIFGPLDALNTLSLYFPLQLSVIAQTLDPVSTKPPGSLGNLAADFGQTIIPTHTFDTAPPVDVLIVPGGIGNRDPKNVEAAIAYVAKVYPTLQYLVTVCTGSGMAAEAGVLDGRRATTNKRAWARTTQLRPQVHWEAHARWVVDGNIWTSSGVSAGLDVIFAFMGEVYGEEVATAIANFLEYERHMDASWDPYAGLYGLA
ncbi:DJ-1/PfpI family protein [Pholiota conissans]|uniref:DJ-1/PfpI family protein n=1 Tax=Pholiota conissans TaxID=109636 RepID=A0A9P5Z8D0_9AGAR|nr:DJ-1/PfpI family protein [Pholiota conissans]